MYKLLVAVLFLCALGGGKSANAAMADYKQDFEINLEEDTLPPLAELEEIFNRENRYYDKKYHSVWDLTGEFDRDFYARAATYGINEKRLKWEEEEHTLEILKALPKEMYPYIGPMLFEIPNMSEKVLNMPGIKETKHQFPKRIAPQLKDIEDIEFLSPFLYYILMPEMWPENAREIERPQMTPYHPKVVYDPKFFAALKKLVPPEDFMSNALPQKPGRSQLRTIKPTPDSLLTSADIQAFARTIDAVEDWYQTGDNRYQLSRISSMLWSYEFDKNPAIVAGLREGVNPCARLVQKARLMGQELELARKVADEGFTLNEWAYTCDKTVKAYRLSRISSSLMQAIRAYKLGLYDDEINKLSPKSQAFRYATMQAIVSAYNAPLADVVEVQKNRPLLEQKWKKYNFKLAGTSLRIEN